MPVLSINNTKEGIMFKFYSIWLIFGVFGWQALANINTGNFVSVCDRTEQVQYAILAVVDRGDCSLVTAQDLEGIEKLFLNDLQINEFKSQDFQGMSALRLLNLSGNPLEGTFFTSALPEGVFNNLASLERVVFCEVGGSLLNYNKFRPHIRLGWEPRSGFRWNDQLLRLTLMERMQLIKPSNVIVDYCTAEKAE